MVFCGGSLSEKFDHGQILRLSSFARDLDDAHMVDRVILIHTETRV